MQEMEITWRRSMSVWWLIAWRGVVGGTVIGGILGFIIGLVGAIVGWPLETISTAASAVGALSGIVWSTFVVRMALRKKYGDFRLALVPHTP